MANAQEWFTPEEQVVLNHLDNMKKRREGLGDDKKSTEVKLI